MVVDGISQTGLILLEGITGFDCFSGIFSRISHMLRVGTLQTPNMKWSLRPFELVCDCKVMAFFIRWSRNRGVVHQLVFLLTAMYNHSDKVGTNISSNKSDLLDYWYFYSQQLYPSYTGVSGRLERQIYDQRVAGSNPQYGWGSEWVMQVSVRCFWVLEQGLKPSGASQWQTVRLGDSQVWMCVIEWMWVRAFLKKSSVSLPWMRLPWVKVIKTHFITEWITTIASLDCLWSNSFFKNFFHFAF